MATSGRGRQADTVHVLDVRGLSPYPHADGRAGLAHSSEIPMDLFAHVNWIAVVVAAVAAFALGAIWFAPPVFGNAWLAALGKPKEEMGMPASAMGLSFVVTLVICLTMAMILTRMPLTTTMGAARLGFAIGAGIVAMGMASDFAFTKWPRKLYWIQASYHVVMMTLIGTILGAWR